MHSAHFCSIAIGLFLTTSHLLAGLEDLTVLTSLDGKQYVILGGDNHGTLPGTQTERLAAAIAECQEKDPTPFEVHIEKPARLFTKYNKMPRITTDLEPAIKTIPGITLEDCEVRNVAILAFWLFDEECPISTRCKVKTGTKECCVRTATLKDLNIEFEELYASLSAYAQTLPRELKEKFEKKLLHAQKLLTKFQDKVKPYVHESNTIIETAIQLADFDRENSWIYERGRIRDCSLEPLSELFNLNLIRSIFSSQNAKKLIVAGLLHTQAIKQFLVESSWQVTYDQKANNPELINFSALSEMHRAPKA
jgi:hypothetical protein